eukprot:1447012-Rhodomonas_salina.2
MARDLEGRVTCGHVHLEKPPGCCANVLPGRRPLRSARQKRIRSLQQRNATLDIQKLEAQLPSHKAKKLRGSSGWGFWNLLRNGAGSENLESGASDLSGETKLVMAMRRVCA